MAKETPLQAAVNAREDAMRHVGETLRRAYPVDAPIAWEHGGRIIRGHVVEHLYQDQLRARNVNTGKVSKVRAYQVARGEHFR